MTFLHPFVDLPVMIVCTMAATLRKCKGKEGKTCNDVLPSTAKDYLELCTVCWVQICIAELKCYHCRDWFVDRWCKVQAHMGKLLEQ